jgi:hypothetical protein
MTTKNRTKKLTLSDVKPGNAKKSTTTASEIDLILG